MRDLDTRTITGLVLATAFLGFAPGVAFASPGDLQPVNDNLALEDQLERDSVQARIQRSPEGAVIFRGGEKSRAEHGGLTRSGTGGTQGFTASQDLNDATD